MEDINWENLPPTTARASLQISVQAFSNDEAAKSVRCGGSQLTGVQRFGNISCVKREQQHAVVSSSRKAELF